MPPRNSTVSSHGDVAVKKDQSPQGLFSQPPKRYFATACQGGSTAVPLFVLKNVATPRKGDSLAMQMIRAAAQEQLRRRGCK